MTLAAGALAIAVAVVGGILAIWLVSGLNVVLSIAAVLGLATIVLYGRDVIEIFGGRKRRQLELNTRMAVLSFASLAGAALLGVVLVLTGAFAAHLGAFAFLAIFGWLSGLVLAKLYKIVAFLTWLETYGPVMGGPDPSVAWPVLLSSELIPPPYVVPPPRHPLGHAGSRGPPRWPSGLRHHERVFVCFASPTSRACQRRLVMECSTPMRWSTIRTCPPTIRASYSRAM